MKRHIFGRNSRAGQHDRPYLHVWEKDDNHLNSHKSNLPKYFTLNVDSKVPTLIAGTVSRTSDTANIVNGGTNCGCRRFVFGA